MTSTLPRSPKSKASPTSLAKRLSAMLSLEDEKNVTIAILEAAIDELDKNSRFAENIRFFYDALVVVHPTTPKKISKGDDQQVFTPIKFVEGLETNMAVTPNPFLMCEAYGPEQFSRMLARDTKTRLLDNVRLVEKGKPGTKLKNKGKATREEIIDFIVHSAS